MWTSYTEMYYDSYGKFLAVKRVSCIGSGEVQDYFYIKSGYGEVRTSQAKFEEVVARAKYFLLDKNGAETKVEL
jgi:hypothetical protein